MNLETLLRLKKLGCEQCSIVFKDEILKIYKNTWSHTTIFSPHANKIRGTNE
ncbi:MAG TPA: hypothetical protein PK074_01835 [Spirochaetales bacterium]|nr:hypothetical protein [Spirochaetales bacterium]HQK33442.1 hypothetical protein [Spirochaetales bacterium]HRV27565.1 hypothetical protein [Spirochaetia bacterium]